MTMQMQDPSQGVHRDLLPHIHLLSTYRFPTLQSVHHNKIAEWLLSAPKIVRDQAPFFWNYLDRPSDGTIIMTWQPLNALGTNFASDGYMWPPAETAFQLEVEGGYTLEMYQHKSGYAPGEPIAVHARRRYRLLPSKFPQPGAVVPDEALWIVHYYPADPHDRVPANMIPHGDVRVQQMMQTRAYLQSAGQLVQKEFMLHDRTNWPQIQFPRGQGRPGYPGGMGATRTPQSMAYPPHAMASGPPSKRARTQTNAPQGPPMGGVPPEHLIDDEEDTSRGDLFDHMTPREVSMSRYMQNHEWMEEILSSPYSIAQILPVDLGLGLKGELGSLTNGVFEPPSAENGTGYIGHLDPGKAEEFRKRANERIADTKAEMEKMKARHARRMEKFKKGALIMVAEKELSKAVHDPSDVGPEYWRLEGRVDDNEDGTRTVDKALPKVDDIVAKVEASLGKHTAVVQELKRIQDGGLEESAPPPPISAEPSRKGSQQSGVLVGDADLDMGSAGGLLDQFHTGLSATSTPGNTFTPQPLAHSSGDTPAVIPSPQPPVGDESKTPAAKPEEKEDVKMTGHNDADNETGDWVVVPEGGVSPEVAAQQAKAEGVSSTADTAPDTSTAETAAKAPEITTTGSGAPTTSAGTSAPASNNGNGDSSNDIDLNMGDTFSGDPVDFGSLEDLDTAGEALADYGHDDHDDDDGLDLGVGGDMDLGDELEGDLGDDDVGMDMGMDDSAFGDAFHGVEERGDGNGEGEGDGL